MIAIDAHCHLERGAFPDVEAILSRARQAGLLHAVAVGQMQQPGDFGRALELAAAHPDLLTPTMGIHPHEAVKARAADFDEVERICERPEVCAVGETGLDFYYQHSPREVQEEAFRWHCRLSLRIFKPLVIHVRDAHQECLRILLEERAQSGVIHCFTGDREAARRYLDLGFFLSISGIVTYPKSDALREAVESAPLDRLMVETDSPYLAPVPHRGKKNEPAFVVEVARKVAEIKGLSPDEAALTAAKNAARLFRLPVTLPA
ncbi:MAG: TatD family hydrolase [Myxococcales bacterium]|nr:TatD family hydrolase [Myxococcales bacterium]